jgi:hypothetical protein
MSALYFVFIHLLLLVPGFALVRKSKLLIDKPALELCAAYLTGIVLMAGFSISGYVFDIPRIWLLVVPWLLIGLGVFYFLRHRLYRDLVQHRFPLLVLATISLFSSAFISLGVSGSQPMIPDPKFVPQNNYQVFSVKVLNVAQTIANDNYVPYRQAQFIVNRSDPAKDSFINEWGVHFFQRTPLMGAVTAQFFNLLGDKPPIGYTWGANQLDPDHTYIKFQLIGQIMNSLFVLPAFYLIRKLWNRKTAQVSLLFMVPSSYYLFNSFFTWPKSLVAFFILFSWLLLYEKRMRYVLMAGVASGVAYLAHDLAVLYIASSVILLLYWRRFRDILFFLVMNAIFALPWLITSAFIYKKPSTFIYYPLSLHDIPQIEKKHQIVHEFFHTSPLAIIAIKIRSLIYLITPYQLFFSEGGQAIGRRLWAGSIYNLPGAAGFGLMIPMFIGLAQKIRNVPLVIFTLAPTLFCVLLVGWPKGMGALHFAEASVAILIGLAVWFLLERKSKVWLWAAFAINCAQLIFFAMYSYNFNLRGWLHPKDLACLFLMTVLLAGCAAGIYIVTTKKGAWRFVSSKLPSLKPAR